MLKHRSISWWIKVILEEPVSWLEEIIRYLPGRIGSVCRHWWWSKRLGRLGRSNIASGVVIEGDVHNIFIGDGVSLARGSQIYSYDGRCEIGNHVYIGVGTTLSAMHGEIKVGNQILIGQNTVILASEHEYRNPSKPIRDSGYIRHKTIIDDDVWLGAGVIVLGGSHIGLSSVVAAGAVVSGEVNPYTIVGGVPAKLLKLRERYDLKSF